MLLLNYDWIVQLRRVFYFGSSKADGKVIVADRRTVLFPAFQAFVHYVRLAVAQKTASPVCSAVRRKHFVIQGAALCCLCPGRDVAQSLAQTIHVSISYVTYEGPCHLHKLGASQSFKERQNVQPLAPKKGLPSGNNHTHERDSLLLLLLSVTVSGRSRTHHVLQSGLTGKKKW